MKQKAFVAGLFFLSVLLFFACKKDKVKGKDVKIKALFHADKTEIIPGDTVYFSDSTTGFPLSWRWKFEGGTPTSSNEQNPKVVYDKLGEFTVSLSVTNAYGRDSVVKVGYIKVSREKILPEVDLIEAFNIQLHTAKVGSRLISEGSAKVTEMGVCWSSARATPNISDSKSFTNNISLDISGGESDGWEEFITDMSNLDENAVYYYRAYAVNEDGVGYSKVQSFLAYERDTCDEITHQSFVDSRDGQRYDYIEIAGMDIMAENLNYNVPGKSWCYGDDGLNCQLYGKLYTRDAALSVCPVGWHLTTEAEWNQIIQTIGENEAGKKLKKKNVWDIRGTNDYCFSAYPTGYKRLSNDQYLTKGFYAYWWTPATQSSKVKVAGLMGDDRVSLLALDDDAYSVRCVKN
ncbi:MAG: PKD domain-containing protein [Chitinophagales bacterium]|nr:PKD domain-containing protein [Chitinophagales bacterium]